MMNVFSLLYIALGSLPGILAVAHVKSYEKREKSYGVINIWYVLLMILISAFTMCFSCRYGISGFEELIKYLASSVCVWLLLLTSYMDQRSGMFHVMPLLAALLMELIFVILYASFGNVFFVKEYWIMVAIIQLLLYLFSIKGYSKGDFGILSVCMYTYLIVCPDELIYAIGTTLFVAMLLFICRNLFRIKLILENKNIRLPFTIYIGIGAFCTLLIYA